MQNWVTSWISEKFSFNVHEKMSRWGGWQWRSLKKKTLNYLFYKGAELSRLTKICPNDSHERVWSQTLLFLYIGTYQVGTGTFFQLTQIKCILLWLLHSRILPILQTGRMFELILCELPEQVLLWQQRAPCGLLQVWLCTLKQGFSTCLPVGWAGHPFVAIQKLCGLHFYPPPK